MSRLKGILIALIAALLGAALVNGQSSVKINLATVAIKESVWDKALRDMANSVTVGTGKRVTMQISANTQGGEKAIVDELGTTSGFTNAALLTSPGLSQIAEEFDVFSLPFFFSSDDEMRFVREKLTSTLAAKLEAKGIHFLAWGEAGWAKFFSKTPIKTVAELKKARLFTSAGDARALQWYQENKFNAVPVVETKIEADLKLPGGIQVVPLPPYVAQILHVHQSAQNMLDLDLAPLVGAVVVSNDVWKRLSEADRKTLTAAAAVMERSVQSSVMQLNRDSIRTMSQRDGLKVIALDAAGLAEFRAEGDRLMTTVGGKIVPKAIFDTALRERDAYRKANPTKR